MKRLTTTDVTEWYYDFKGSQYGYLLLNSNNQTIIQELMQYLEESGIICLKKAPSFKVASNNKNYKVYLSVARASGGRPTLLELKAIIRRNLPNLHYDASSTEVREYFNSLQDTIDANQKTIAIKDERIRSLEQSLLNLEQVNARQRDSFNSERQELLAKVHESKLVDDLINEEYIRNKQAEKDTQERYQSEVNKLRAYHIEELNDLATQLGKVQLERDSALDEILKLKQQRHASQSTSKHRSGMSEKDLSEILCSLLPKLSFDDHSIRYILDEIKDRRPLLRYLIQINNGETLPFESFQAVDGWMELQKHISDGHDPDVRIYFKKDKGTSKCCVHVSAKQYQLQGITARILKELG